jgi:aminopeptidase N
LETERDELNINRILDYLERTYWRFLRPDDRLNMVPQVEELLWRLMVQSTEPRRKAAYFNTFRDVAQSDYRSIRGRLTRIFHGSLNIFGLPLSERDLTRLAFELAVRETAGWEGILQTQSKRITNPDRKARLAFVMPALSDQGGARDDFFESLKDPKNREQEPWVLQALNYLHHPLRATEAEKYILPSLELLEEIQRTGDIFFPKRWLDATLAGHQSGAVADIVRGFLDGRPEYPAKLKGKILQSADGLFRAADIIAN